MSKVRANRTRAGSRRGCPLATPELVCLAALKWATNDPWTLDSGIRFKVSAKVNLAEMPERWLNWTERRMQRMASHKAMHYLGAVGGIQICGGNGVEGLRRSSARFGE
ncbi:hypothetical protein C8R46DRAFT_1027305 [Mycena filopes]|nr:hypothetical protein C8R46DRAFT_1027305 [Mycena filopes]